MAKIYLSSTLEDLQACRAQTHHTLRQHGHDVVSMEDCVASGQRPLAQCLADAADCDACVGLVAWLLGFVPAGSVQSITELELLAAERGGLPCLVFLLDDDAPWPPSMVDDDRRAVLALRQRLRERFTVASFRGAGRRDAGGAGLRAGGHTRVDTLARRRRRAGLRLHQLVPRCRRYGDSSRATCSRPEHARHERGLTPSRSLEH